MLPVITPQDLLVIAFLIFLEGVLSIDNALVLALLAKPLPKNQQRKALTYGLVGAVLFRVLAISMAALLIRSIWVKFLGGAYLIWLGTKNLWHGEGNKTISNQKHGFWMTILIIELTDIAFAVDSILAAVALTPKVWVIITGGLIGLVMMRFAASLFISLLERFPAFEKTAYQLVLLIGMKLVIEGCHLPGIDFHSAESLAFWIFWLLMALIIAGGFRTSRSRAGEFHKIK